MLAACCQEVVYLAVDIESDELVLRAGCAEVIVAGRRVWLKYLIHWQQHGLTATSNCVDTDIIVQHPVLVALTGSQSHIAVGTLVTVAVAVVTIVVVVAKIVVVIIANIKI